MVKTKAKVITSTKFDFIHFTTSLTVTLHACKTKKFQKSNKINSVLNISLIIRSNVRYCLNKNRANKLDNGKWKLGIFVNSTKLNVPSNGRETIGRLIKF